MLNPNFFPASMAGHALAIKLGGILAPAVLLSFIGGMLLWRALHPDSQAALEEKLEKLREDNKELHRKFRQLSENLSATPPPVSLSPEPLSPLSKNTTSPGKLTMLRKVLEENLQLRATAQSDLTS